MTREYFENKGWKFFYEHGGIIKFTKGDTWAEDGMGAFMEYRESDNNLIITTTDKGFNSEGPKISIKYNGMCENEEMFDLVCKLIRLKI